MPDQFPAFGRIAVIVALILAGAAAHVAGNDEAFLYLLVALFLGVWPWLVRWRKVLAIALIAFTTVGLAVFVMRNPETIGFRAPSHGLREDYAKSGENAPPANPAASALHQYGLDFSEPAAELRKRFAVLSKAQHDNACSLLAAYCGGIRNPLDQFYAACDLVKPGSDAKICSFFYDLILRK